MRAVLRLEPTEPVVVIGLMSGTSADGVDAACVRLSHPPGEPLEWELLGSAVASYSGSLANLLRASESLTLPDIARLGVEVGVAFAEAAAAAAAQARVSLDQVALIGSHGQTVWHDPDGAVGGVPATLQIGEPAEIAERTGCPVWSDFRTADIAAGGQGAPLVPYVDWLLFGDPDRWTVCLNLGGIANLTVLPPGAARGDVIAFDTGPGNMVLDELARRLLDADRDDGGAAASRGTADAARLQAALADPYFSRPAPKSTGREAFGTPFVERHFAPLEGLSTDEIDERMATAAALTVESVAAALEGSAGTASVPEDAVILVSGGGRKNAALMYGLAERCLPRRVIAIEERGVDGDLKEAIAFAILAYESALGRAVNLPSATGAKHAVRCGKLTLPPPTDE
ncbi:MAG: anhydro-N-acetylmuramic acid kinase [Gemmatimonadetes bacterium]|nr:anhydro-N-acetylmuramic acid kinase [Gemmatimonadota bacterium]